MKYKILSNHLSFATPVALAVILIESIRIGLMARLQDRNLVQYIPDDAFYYLQAAHNFAQNGRWTFDGVEPSSGFHFMWGYLLAALYKVHDSITLHNIFLIGSFLQMICLALAAFFVTKTVERFAGWHGYGGVLSVFLSAISLLQATSMMETCFVILASAITLYFLARLDCQLTPNLGVVAFLLGVSISLARSDAGLLVFLFVIAHLYRWLRGHGSLSMVLASVFTLTGVASGFGLVTLNTHWVSGQWVQASAQQKVFWTHVVGPSSGGPAHLVSNFFNPIYNIAVPYSPVQEFLDRHLHPIHHIYPIVAAFIALALLAIGAGLIFWLRSKPVTDYIILVLVPIATLFGYIFIYRYVSAAVQSWYIGNFEAPLAMVTGIALAGFLARGVKVASCLVVLLVMTGIICSFKAPSPWAESIWRAGIYLHEHPTERPVGAWNAGILSYFAGGEVVNLDGLMNDSILPYAQRGDLKSYLAKRRIYKIFDSPQMWNANSSALGGYANGELERCIVTNQDPFPGDPYNNFGGDRIRLYTLDPACLNNPQH